MNEEPQKSKCEEINPKCDTCGRDMYGTLNPDLILCGKRDCKQYGINKKLTSPQPQKQLSECYWRCELQPHQKVCIHQPSESPKPSQPDHSIDTDKMIKEDWELLENFETNEWGIMVGNNKCFPAHLIYKLLKIKDRQAEERVKAERKRCAEIIREFEWCDDPEYLIDELIGKILNPKPPKD